MIITIDGPAGSGKSTIADVLAEKLGFIHFNSGSLYRAITAYLYEQQLDIEQLTIDSAIPSFNLAVKMIEDVQHCYVNNVDYTPVLRENHISTLVAYVAQNKHCRKRIDECQKEFCSTHNVVMEGRDLGSFVFPNAEVKFYLDCSVEERARRRFLEVKVKDPNISIEEIKKQIEERDYIDKTRKIAPLVVPKDAIIIDSSLLSIEQVANAMLSHIQTHQI